MQNGFFDLTLKAFNFSIVNQSCDFCFGSFVACEQHIVRVGIGRCKAVMVFYEVSGVVHFIGECVDMHEAFFGDHEVVNRISDIEKGLSGLYSRRSVAHWQKILLPLGRSQPIVFVSVVPWVKVVLGKDAEQFPLVAVE